MTGTDLMATGGFDYAKLDPDVAVAMRTAAEHVRNIGRAAVVDVGRELIAAKGRVEHGEFVKWVERDCQISIRSAERAMQVAELVDQNDNLSYLPPDGLIALSSRLAPPSAVAEIIKQIESGERPMAAVIKRQIQEARYEAKCAAEEAERAAAKARMTPRQRRTRAQREAESERQKQEWKQETAERHAAAEAAVVLLVDCIGDRLDEFRKLIEKAKYSFTHVLSLYGSDQRPAAGAGID